MPLPTESLTPSSSDTAVRKAISDSISQCMQEGGKQQDQCVAIAHETARRATRHNSGHQPTRKVRAGLSDRKENS